MERLAPFLLRAIARGARVLTLDYHLPSASDGDAIKRLPPDCQPLAPFLTPREVHLFGKMRLHYAASRGEEQGQQQQGPAPPPPPQQLI